MQQQSNVKLADFPNAFSFTSDGDREDWQDAINYYDANLPGNHAFNLTAHL